MNGAADPRRLILWTVGAVVGAVLLLGFLYRASGALLLIYVSALLAMGMAPLVRAIERIRLRGRSLPRWLAVAIVYVVVIAMLVGLGFAVVPTFAEQAREFVALAPEWFDRVQAKLIDWGVLSEPMTLREAIEEAPGMGGDLARNVAMTAWSVFGGALGVISLLFLTFYFQTESRMLYDTFLRFMPRARRARAGRLACEIVDKTSAWLGGQLLLSGIIGTSAAIALGVMGVPYFYVLALIAAVGEAVPVVGPIVAAVPAVLVAASVSSKLAIAVAVFYLVQQQIENYVLVPKLMERQVGLDAVTVIVALLLGSSLLGVTGAILAVPTAAILKVVVLELGRDTPTERSGRRAA